jgi:transcriptional regulator with XRE-family HTH domain
MPRVNTERSLDNERMVAARIAYERQQNDWSYQQTSNKLKRVGGSLGAAEIQKIEKENRRLSIDELVAFAKLFKLSPNEIMTPLELVLNKRAMEFVRKADHALEALAKSVRELIETSVELSQLQQTNSRDQSLVEVRKRVAEYMPTQMITYPMGDEDDPSTPDPVGEAWLALGTGVAEYAAWHVATEGGAKRG